MYLPFIVFLWPRAIRFFFVWVNDIQRCLLTSGGLRPDSNSNPVRNMKTFLNNLEDFHSKYFPLSWASHPNLLRSTTAVSSISCGLLSHSIVRELFRISVEPWIGACSLCSKGINYEVLVFMVPKPHCLKWRCFDFYCKRCKYVGFETVNQRLLNRHSRVILHIVFNRILI